MMIVISTIWNVNKFKKINKKDTAFFRSHSFFSHSVSYSVADVQMSVSIAFESIRIDYT